LGKKNQTPLMAGVVQGALVATEEHCRFCFDVLIAQLKEHRLPLATFGNKDLKAPLFVTWKVDNGDGEYTLRGCIGNFSDLHLGDGLTDYALSSGLQDSRFSPISLNEVNSLMVAVSLLIDFEDAQHVYDWEVGIHGIRISFHDGQKARNATYLPEVALEQNWNHEQAVHSLIRKSGFRGPISNSILGSIKLVRYKSSKAHLPYHKYKKL